MITKDDVLGIIYYIRKQVALSRNKEEALEKIDKIIDEIEEEFIADFVRRHGLTNH